MSNLPFPACTDHMSDKCTHRNSNKKLTLLKKLNQTKNFLKEKTFTKLSNGRAKKGWALNSHESVKSMKIYRQYVSLLSGNKILPR